MKTVNRYKKAIAAALGGLVTLAAAFGFDMPGGEETVAAMATVLATALVVWSPKNED